LVRDIKKAKKEKGRSSRRERDAAHIRSRSKSKAKSAKTSKHFAASSQTLKDLMSATDGDADEFATYEGVTLFTDEKYGFNRVRISEDGATLATATRKIRLFSVTPSASASASSSGLELREAAKVIDSDNAFVRSLNLKDGLVLTSRSGCVRSKLWSAADGKVQKVIKCKKAIAQSDFLCDSEWAVVLTQELIANEAPKPPAMRLYRYNDSSDANKNDGNGGAPKLATSQSATYFEASAE